MSEFADQMQRFKVDLAERNKRAFVGISTEAHRSIQVGSELTAAPGQPVDIGTLRGSYLLDFPEPMVSEIATELVSYAPSIEDGVSYAHNGTPLTLRSEVGGFHSIKMTVAGLQNIVDKVVGEVGSR